MPLPAGFRFGVTMSGLQVEGGYNGLGQPENNWLDWERAGRVARSGPALDFWNRYPEVLDRAAAAGCDTVRLSVEWARCEPVPGTVDEAAFARYCAILDACHERNLEPVVALHHFTSPRWLGPNFWLDLAAPERFAAWAGLAVERLGGRCQHWVTLDGINALAFGTYLTAALPPGRLGRAGDAVRAAGHLLTAHVLADRVLRQCQPEAVVGAGTHAASVYELDRLLVDVLVGRSRNVARHELGPWLAERRRAYYATLPAPSPPERLLRRVAASVLPLDQAVPRSVSEVYRGPVVRPLDVIQLHWSDPRSLCWLCWSRGHHCHRDGVHPQGLITHCRPDPHPSLDVWVTGGLSQRVVAGRPLPRHDGWDRVRYLHAVLGGVAAAVEAGAPITRYLHRTLADSYEWGSYQHRYGLFAVDHDGPGQWSDRDSFGGDAAGAYRDHIESLRGGPPPAPVSP